MQGDPGDRLHPQASQDGAVLKRHLCRCERVKQEGRDVKDYLSALFAGEWYNDAGLSSLSASFRGRKSRGRPVALQVPYRTGEGATSPCLRRPSTRENVL